MNTLTSYIKNHGIEKEIEQVAKLSGFEFVGDYLQNLFDREIKIAKAKKELYKQIQEGIDSGYVDWNESLIKDLDEKYK